MTLPIPSLAEHRSLARDAVAARLSGYAGAPGNNRARVLADAMGALAFGTNQYVAYLALMFLPDTATGEWLDRWANIWLGGRQAATFATGSATVTGIAGTVLPIATQIGAGDTTFETTAQITVDVGATEVPVRALTAGVVGNLDAGTSLSILTAVAGVDGAATVVSLSGGVDVESDDFLRDRILQRIRKPPMGGAADDYVTWARDVPGVTRAWTEPNGLGPGSVVLRFMMDDLRTTAAGFPTQDDVAVVQAYIDQRRPVAARDFLAAAPVPEPVNFTIAALVPNSASVRAGIAVNVAAMLAERAAPARAVNGIKVPAQTIHREWVSSAILAAPGVESFDLTMSDHIMPSSGSLAVLGTITYA